jgi:ABC-2 type transport system permease protein
MMRFVLATARKDLLRLRRDPLALAAWVGIPLTIALLLHLAVGGRGQARPRGLLLVADEDQSAAGLLLTGAFSQGPLAEMVTVERVNQASGRERMRRGKAAALLVIPKGFGSAFLQDRPARLRLVTNPAQQIVPEIIRETLSIVVEGGFYLQQVVGDSLRTIASGPGPQGFPDVGVADLSVRFNQLATRLRGYFDPLLIRVETVVQETRRPFRFSEAFFPGMLILGLMFVSQGLGADLWREKDLGTLRRAAALPQGLRAFVAGKAAAAAVAMLVVSATGLAFGRALLEVPVASWPLAVGWLTVSGVAFYLLLSVVQLLASSARMGNILASVVVFPLTMAGGSFFPFELMPQGMARIGRWTPNGWILTQLRELLGGAPEWPQLGLRVAVLAGAGAVLFLLVTRRVRRLV